MTDWDSGYVTDIPYMASFYHDQSPTHLNFICLLNGFQPRSLEQAFTYCEIGCGRGLTTNVLAATYPLGRFYGVDFHPAHIAEARDTATGAQLDNVEFIEQSFEEFLLKEAPDPLADFDFMTLHGVYSWVEDSDRRRIVELLRRRLKPGGIVYISYNSLPGWSAGAPIQKLLYEYGKLAIDRSDQRFEAALAFLQALHQEGSPMLSGSPFFDRIIEIRQADRVPYLTHEYMTANWHPQYHVDVARELANAKLGFIGSSNALENFPDLNFTQAHQALLAQINDTALRETTKDYLFPRLLRKDVFVRGPRRLHRDRQAELLMQMGLALLLPRQQAKLSMKTPLGNVSADAAVFTPVLDALAERPHTMEELLAVAGMTEKTGAKAAEIAGILIGTWQAAATLVPQAQAPSEVIQRFNLNLAKQAMLDELSNQFPLTAPILGSALHVSGLEMRIYQAVVTGLSIEPDALADRIWKTLEAQGERLVKDGQVLQKPAENLAFLQDTIRSILTHNLPVWRRLGILPETS